MKLSIVIGTYNRCDLLRAHLPAICEQDFPVTDYEVVVVVDGSNDATVSMLRDFRAACELRVVEQENQGLAAARQAGVMAARGAVILFLDDDMRCARDLARKHVAAHEANRAPDLVLFGPVLLDAESPASLANDWLALTTDHYFDQLARGGEIPPTHRYVPPNSSMKREMLQRLGPIPRRAGHRFDLDFGLALWEAGVRFRFLAEAETRHLGTKTARDLVRDAYAMGLGELEVYRHHPSYRPYSWLDNATSGSWWKRVGRRLTALYPWFLMPVDVAVEAAGRLRQFARVRRLGLSLLHLRCAAAQWQGAAEAAGGWNALAIEIAQLRSRDEGTQARAAAAHARLP